MMLRGCPREEELKQVVEAGQWPLACAEDLRAHVDGCSTCGEYLLLTNAFRAARAGTMSAARPSSPGLLWWRAQLRRRNEAVERINRPIVGAQIFALCVTLAAGLGFAVYETRGDGSWLERLARLPHAAAEQLAGLWPDAAAGSGWGWALPLAAVCALALVGSMVVFFSTDRR